ncbi:hypothetical protein EIN_403060 [Entamoeba invadens IP1]|uniref:Uncharacterized protein n=1 Tax=Entamoeba invadens IP1 TaxID=370355 RepID=A0A0A1U6H2_ENTIV|nr:hypothetical protein EIN_403060 [Entamoeba invadens IP1]ELP89992.1 hypothetical protein EIN_403060 [Entamoeba invadens IP1]|eukprot:XP_004256763.1 hypothetical protein EIN_403060 [Entamoeba invadens IP1]
MDVSEKGATPAPPEVVGLITSRTSGRAEFMRIKKRKSRDEEASLANSYLFLLLSECDGKAVIKYTKIAQKTVKLYSVESLSFDNMTFTQDMIREEGRKLLLKNNFKKEDLTTDGMSEKQQKRSVEAEMSNGYLELLIGHKFIADIKQTKSSKKTIKMVRISKLTSPSGTDFSKSYLGNIGNKFAELVQNGFRGHKTLNLDRLFVDEIRQMITLGLIDDNSNQNDETDKDGKMEEDNKENEEKVEVNDKIETEEKVETVEIEKKVDHPTELTEPSVQPEPRNEKSLEKEEKEPEVLLQTPEAVTEMEKSKPMETECIGNDEQLNQPDLVGEQIFVFNAGNVFRNEVDDTKFFVSLDEIPYLKSIKK